MSQKQMNVNVLNKHIQEKNNIEKSEISDGFHSFGELYDHRAAVFIALARQFKSSSYRFTANHDGKVYDGFFGLCINLPGLSVSYHLDNKFLSEVVDFVHYQKNPFYDGHTSTDVFQRLLKIKELAADQALIKENQKLSANNRVLSNNVAKLNETISKLESDLAQCKRELQVSQES